MTQKLRIAPTLRPTSLRIALAQMNQRIGDLSGNAAAILTVRAAAGAQGAELVLTPELQLTGYPVEDLVLKPEFVRRTLEATERLVDATADGGPALLFGICAPPRCRNLALWWCACLRRSDQRTGDAL